MLQVEWDVEELSSINTATAVETNFLDGLWRHVTLWTQLGPVALTFSQLLGEPQDLALSIGMLQKLLGATSWARCCGS